MFCSKCGTLVLDGASFCNKCGNAVQNSKPTCSKCGAETSTGMKFCGKCGNALRGTPVAQYRQTPPQTNMAVFETANKPMAVSDSGERSDFDDDIIEEQRRIKKKWPIITSLVIIAAIIVTWFLWDDEIGSFTDPRDGQTYRTVKMPDGKIWMAENLNYRMEMVRTIMDRLVDTTYSRCYEDDSANCTKYGSLYTWEMALEVCPARWRLPTNNDWENLINVIGGKESAGNALKSTLGWSNNNNGTDLYGFSALPGGMYRVPMHHWEETAGLVGFDDIGNSGRWWSATKDALCCSNSWGIVTEVEEFQFTLEDYLLSVRCVMDI